MINQTLGGLLAAAREDEEIALRAVAYRIGLLWRCPPCGLDNAGGAACLLCEAAAPQDVPELTMTVFPVVDTRPDGAGLLAVYDGQLEAHLLAEAVNIGLGASAGPPAVRVGHGIDLNPTGTQRQRILRIATERT